MRCTIRDEAVECSMIFNNLGGELDAKAKHA